MIMSIHFVFSFIEKSYNLKSHCYKSNENKYKHEITMNKETNICLLFIERWTRRLHFLKNLETFHIRIKLIHLSEKN